MPRSLLSMEVADLSTFAKSVREQINRLDHQPSHVEMLNLLSRAAGFRNVQHLRAARSNPDEGLAPVIGVLPVPNESRVLKSSRLFDRDGRLVQWPARRSQQELCLWYLWSRIPAGERFTEKQFSNLLNELHLFGDAAMLRRDMFGLGLVRRNRDGSDYQRVEQKPPPELPLLSRAVNALK